MTENVTPDPEQAQPEEFDFSFRIPARQERRTCDTCGQEFIGSRTTCQECEFYEKFPEMAPGYWTWTRRGETGWNIQASWRESEPWPLPGTTVTVHRKNGTTSRETILEVENTYYDRAVNFNLICSVAAG